MYTKNNLSKFLAAVFFALSLSLISLSAADYSDEITKAKNSIKGRMLFSHVEFLASPYCRGRETGEKGIDLAAAYIDSVLKGAGLEPAGDFGSYRQTVYLEKYSLSGNCYLKIEESRHGGKLFKNATLDEDYLPVFISAEKEASAPLVFAGYGITAPKYNYDDYKGLDVRGKIVMVLRHEPRENDESGPFEGRIMSQHGTLLTKIIDAQEHGALGILFVTGPLNRERRRASDTDGTWWPSVYKERYKDEEDYQFINFSEDVRIVGADFGVRIPAAALDGRLAARLLGDDHSLKRIQEKIDKTMKPVAFPLTGKKVSLGIDFKNTPVNAYNIVAKIEGSDPELKDEAVIVGGHYDHVGKNKRGQVYPGADDNASGTAGVLELARAFQNLPTKPKRTLLFILFTAEEKGLYGSKYYVDNPVFPLEKTIAMFNLDMIGRNDVDQVSVVGRYQYPGLYKIVETANKKSVNLEINFSVEQFVRNSDHMPFMRNNVPVMFFNSGTHDQLHRPEDTAGRVLPEKMEKITRLLFLGMWDTANLPAGTRLDNPEQGKK